MTVLSQCEYKLVEIVQETVVPLLYVHSVIKLSFLPW